MWFDFLGSLDHRVNVPRRKCHREALCAMTQETKAIPSRRNFWKFLCLSQARFIPQFRRVTGASVILIICRCHNYHSWFVPSSNWKLCETEYRWGFLGPPHRMIQENGTVGFSWKSIQVQENVPRHPKSIHDPIVFVCLSLSFKVKAFVFVFRFAFNFCGHWKNWGKLHCIK